MEPNAVIFFMSVLRCKCSALLGVDLLTFFSVSTIPSFLNCASKKPENFAEIFHFKLKYFEKLLSKLNDVLVLQVNILNVYLCCHYWMYLTNLRYKITDIFLIRRCELLLSFLVQLKNKNGSWVFGSDIYFFEYALVFLLLMLFSPFH